MSLINTSGKFKIFYINEKLNTNTNDLIFLENFKKKFDTHPLVTDSNGYTAFLSVDQQYIQDPYIKFYIDGDPNKEVLTNGNEPLEITDVFSTNGELYIKILPSINNLSSYNKLFKISFSGYLFDGSPGPGAHPFTFVYNINISLDNNGIKITYDSNKPFTSNGKDAELLNNVPDYFPYYTLGQNQYHYLTNIIPPSIGEFGMYNGYNSDFNYSNNITINQYNETFKYYTQPYNLLYRIKSPSNQNISGDILTRTQFEISTGAVSGYITDNWIYIHEIYAKDIPSNPDTGGGGSEEYLKYFFNESINEILISSKSAEDATKISPYFPSEHSRYWEMLIDYNNPQILSINSSNNINISSDEAVYCFIGNKSTDDFWQDPSKKYKYNRYSHKPYKIYLIVNRGQADADGKYKAKVTDAYVYYPESKASDDIGTVTFNTSMEGKLILRGEVKFEKIDPSKTTWGKVTLKINKKSPNGNWDSSLGAVQSMPGVTSNPDFTYHTPFTTGNSEEVLEVFKVFQDSSEYNIGDKYKLSLEVEEGGNNVETGIKVTNYEFVLGTKVEEGLLSSTYFNNSNLFNQDLDCHPDLNNIDSSRENGTIFDLEYSNDILIPKNLKQVMDRTEVPSTVNPYLYSLTGIKNSRFDGSYIYNQKINEYTDKDRNTYGKTPSIEVKRAYFAYYNALHNLYPLVNNKILFDIKYMVGPQGEISSPVMDEIAQLNLINTFSMEEISDEVKIYADTSKYTEFKDINKKFFIDTLGWKPYPVFYSQISATPTKLPNGEIEKPYATKIDFWGLKETLGEQPFNDYSFEANNDIAGSIAPTTEIDGVLSPDNVRSLDIDDNGNPTNINTPWYNPSSGVTTLPITDKDPGIGKPLSNNYKFTFEHTIPTTYIHDIKYQNITKKRQWLFWNKTITTNGTFEDVGYYELWVDGEGFQTSNTYNNSSLVPKTFNLKNYSISMNVYYTDSFSPNGYKVVSFDVSNSLMLINTKNNGQSIILKFNNDIIEGLIKNSGYSIKTTAQGGNLSLITWTIKGEVDDSIVQGSKFNIKVKGELSKMEPIANQNPQNQFFPSDTILGTQSPVSNDIIRLLGDRQDESRSIDIGTNGKYWAFPDINGIKYNMLTLEVANANSVWGKKLRQVDLKYKPTESKLFRDGKEPTYTSFPKIQYSWEPEVGDEIRFGNDENEVYTIVLVEGPKTIDNNSDKLRITLDRDITPTLDLNFFLIRRWKEERGNIIVNGEFPQTNSETVNTTQGFIFPEYLSDEINSNPDKILKDLTEKGIIS